MYKRTNIRGVSVIVCCYNSAQRLSETLKHIASQKVPDYILWEVIVVDNNSTDNTGKVAFEEWHKHNLSIPFKVVTEVRAGLIFARQKGVEASQFDLLLFCDDDNWLEENYIHYGYEIMNSNKKIGVLGGKSEGYFETEKPEWFMTFRSAYAIGKQHRVSGNINGRGFVAGAGMVIRKQAFDLLDSIGFKPMLTGRKGKDLTSGEDAELCLVLLFLGYDLYYDERLQFIHYMPATRLKWKYCVSMMARGHAIPQLYLEFYKYCHKKISNGEKATFEIAYKWIVRKTGRKLLSNFASTKPFWQQVTLFIKSQPGSKKEIELKANLNKLKYLLSHKKDFRQDFDMICTLMQNIMKYKIETANHLASFNKIS